MEELIVPRPTSAGLLLSYKCSGSCKHCLYGCCPQWDADWVSESDLECYLRQLSGMLEPSFAGPDNIDLNAGLHFTGGEPFLNFKLLVRAVEMADEMNIPSTFVETNCFWASDDETTESKLQQLRSAGLKGIMISANPFVLEHVPFERTERVSRIGRDVFARNAVVYQRYFFDQFRALGITDTMGFDEYLVLAGEDTLRYAELILMGRFCYSIGRYFRKAPAEAFFSQSCASRLASPHHIHIDNYGNYMGGFCGGISLGDAHDLDSIFSGVSLSERPVLKALTTSLGELYELAADFGYEQLSEGYISPCHLCMDIRKHLVEQTDRFVELRPKQLYSHVA